MLLTPLSSWLLSSHRRLLHEAHLYIASSCPDLDFSQGFRFLGDTVKNFFACGGLKV